MAFRTFLPVFLLLIVPYTWCGLSFAADGIKVIEKNVVSSGDSQATTMDILGMRGDYVHPYLSIRGEYTDNLYNVVLDEKNDFLTVVSPGIWFAIPAVGEVPISITPHNTASGGLRLGVQEKESFDRFQAYLLGGLDFENYSENSNLNATNYRFEGMLQFNLRGGISLRLLDRYGRDQDRFDVNSFTSQDVNINPAGITLSDPSNIRRFNNNLGSATLNWDMTEKFTARIDYTNFYLDYEGSTNQWLNRTDNSLNAHLYYTYSPKTSFFAEYRYVDAHYNDEHRGMDADSKDVENRDNQQNFVYGGINWAASVKTSLMAKAGYQDKSYEVVDIDSQDSFVFELLGNYRITEKTSLGLTLYKALEESNSFEANGKDTTMVKLRYEQKIYNRFVGVVDFWYSYNDYDQNLSGIDEDYNYEQNLYSAREGDRYSREDDRYYIRPALRYLFKDWLMAELAYSYDKRDSTRKLFDYDTNTILFSLNAAL